MWAVGNREEGCSCGARLLLSRVHEENMSPIKFCQHMQGVGGEDVSSRPGAGGDLLEQALDGFSHCCFTVCLMLSHGEWGRGRGWGWNGDISKCSF